jgi:outer membrane beta-barrel protein
MTRIASLLFKTILTLFLLRGSFEVYASEKDLYDFLWLDPDKKVYVLQKKIYKKAKSFYFNLGYAKGLGNTYQDVSGVHFSGGYYFKETWAIEAKYSQYNNKENDDMESLRRLNGSIPFIRKVERTYGLSAVWSPFYGKINTFNKIIYFDWSFGIGLGQIQTESNALSVSDPNTANIYNDEKYLALLGKTSLRVHLNRRFHVGIEYHHDTYRAPGPKYTTRPQEKSWRSHRDLIFSIGINF